MTQRPPTLLLWLDEATAVEGAPAPPLPPGRVRIVHAPRDVMPPDDVLDDAEIVFVWNMPQGAIGRMPRLQWIQAATGGIENWMGREDLAPHIVLTCARCIREDEGDRLVPQLRARRGGGRQRPERPDDL